jgi:hypothetical protein
MLLNTKKELLKLCLCLALCLSATLLFFVPDESVSVFAQNKDFGVKGLYTLVKSLCF